MDTNTNTNTNVVITACGTVDCSQCQCQTCAHRDAYRRNPRSVGGLGLCPLLDASQQ